MAALVETKNVTKTYGMNGVAVEAVRGIDLRVEEGEFVAIVGPSGSGKSSLLHLIGAMDQPTSGEVFFRGKALSKMNDSARTDLRGREIGFIFQTFNLLPMLNTFENVEVVTRFGRLGRREPTGNLDSATGTGILELLREICNTQKQTVIMVTHDFRAASYADRVLVLRDGRIRGEAALRGVADTHKTLNQLLELELA
jgi:putative ABC transport system ATP-binding protein